uniref:Permeases of the drug/metabolite transporter family protein, permease component n=3 Tax=environmental samples TaxID=68359 RepID=A0A075FWQ8_9EURY|nr:Permeases of the drug/metabolite transporter family protein, permease component [uncultured marine group II/III euryarchaeote AD1000_42_A01]AIE94002.1 Permeases of the drug/metabolite transporter family protein, permease component [uncultured marine group II/III euryarchaeote AD1000_42_A02]AIE94032.1 Permeases of the drug/metabolite transporter family protein, permease component [uncultured marine group II/III euryarchaeote AD1000_42_B01]
MTADLDRRTMLVALAGAVAISFSPVFYIYSDTNPSTGAFFRMLYALPALALLAFLVRKADTRSSRTRWTAFGAGLILAPDMLSYHSSMIFIGIGIATLIGNSQVIIVTLASWKLFGEKPNPAILLSLPVVIIGLALISGIADPEPYGEDPVKGVVFGMMAAFFYSSFLILFRYSNRELAPSSSVQLDATAGAALGLLVLGLLPLSSMAIEPLELQPTWPGHGWLIVLALLCQVAGWLAIAHALPRLPAAHTSFAVLLQPVLTLVWGYVILHQEGHSQNQAIGVFLVLAAIIAVTLYGSASSAEAD